MAWRKAVGIGNLTYSMAAAFENCAALLFEFLYYSESIIYNYFVGDMHNTSTPQTITIIYSRTSKNRAVSHINYYSNIKCDQLWESGLV
jgi:hypothetical protein